MLIGVMTYSSSQRFSAAGTNTDPATILVQDQLQRAVALASRGTSLFLIKFISGATLSLVIVVGLLLTDGICE